MRSLSRLLASATRFYGAHPLNLLALLGCFALAGAAAVHVAADPLWPWMLVWFLAAVIGHDLVLFPLYALADRTARFALHRLHRASTRARGTTDAEPAVPAVNHVRLPVLGSALLFVMFFPGIVQQGAGTYFAATGKTQEPYLDRWLLLCAIMFGLSAIIYAVRVRRASRPHRALTAVATTIVSPGERVLAVGTGPSGDCAAIATRFALYHQSEKDTSTWQRTAWTEVDHVHWQSDNGGGTLVAVGPPPDAASAAEVRLSGPGRLPEIAHDLIAATLIVTTKVYIGDEHGAVITTRRQPGTDRLVWTVRVDQGLDPQDPTVQAEIDAAIHGIRLDLGVPPTEQVLGLDHER